MNRNLIADGVVYAPYVTDSLALTVAKVVVELRHKKNWTQDDLAEKAGLSRYKITKIETGFYEPVDTEIASLARAFKVRPSVMVSPLRIPYDPTYKTPELIKHINQAVRRAFRRAEKERPVRTQTMLRQAGLL